MSQTSLSQHSRDNLIREFDSGISKLRYELVKNLGEIDARRRDKVENVVSVFNQRLLVFQHDFLQMIAQMQGGAPNQTQRLNLNTKGTFYLPTVVGGLAGAAGGACAAGLVVTTTATGMWWWAGTQAVSLAGYLAGAAGVSVDVATGGLTIGGGLAGALALNKGLAGINRKRIRERIFRDFENQVVPQLRAWAKKLLNE